MPKSIALHAALRRVSEARRRVAEVLLDQFPPGTPILYRAPRAPGKITRGVVSAIRAGAQTVMVENCDTGKRYPIKVERIWGKP